MGIIRFLLATSVVVGHSTALAGNTLVGGPGAVQLFYVISGFYMALVLNEKYSGANGYRVFITARLWRLVPCYYAVLILSIALSLAWNQAPLQSPATSGWTSVPANSMHPGSLLFLVASNVLLVGQDVAMFLAYHADKGTLYFTPTFYNEALPASRFLFVPQAWSLGTELMFYAVAPFLVRRKSYLWASVGLSLAVKLLLYQRGLNYDPWTYRFLPAQLWVFALGSLGYHLYAHVRDQKWAVERWSSPLTWATVTGLWMLGYIPLLTQERWHSVLVVAFAGLVPLIFIGTKDSRWDQNIGELSYPMYLIHSVVLLVLVRVGNHNTAPLAVPLTVAGGVVLWRFVDLPFKRLSRLLTVRRQAANQGDSRRSGDFTSQDPLAS